MKVLLVIFAFSLLANIADASNGRLDKFGCHGKNNQELGYHFHPNKSRSDVLGECYEIDGKIVKKSYYELNQELKEKIKRLQENFDYKRNENRELKNKLKEANKDNKRKKRDIKTLKQQVENQKKIILN